MTPKEEARKLREDYRILVRRGMPEYDVFWIAGLSCNDEQMISDMITMQALRWVDSLPKNTRGEFMAYMRCRPKYRTLEAVLEATEHLEP